MVWCCGRILGGRADQHPRHAGRQQVRRDGEQGGAHHGRRGRGPAVGLQLHGDVCQNQPQRQGAVPGASQHGEEPQHFAAVRLEGQVPAQRHEEDQGEVYAHVGFRQ